MRTQSIDTSPEVERIQIELIRQASITKRFALMESMTDFVTQLAKQEIRRNSPDISEQEIMLTLFARQYGQPLADKAREALARRQV